MSVIKGTKDNFEEMVLKSEKPVLVDFNATWCGPCKMLAPVLDELSGETDKFNVVAVDVDENEDLASTYGIYSIPCLVVFKNGEEVNRSVGFIPKEDIEKLVGEK